MKKLLRTLAAALFGVLLLSSTASAQTITNGNGTDSTNTITQSNSTNISVSCSNSTSIVSTNNQTSSSGDATATGNTTVGNVSSGSASNTSTTATSIASGCGVPLASNTPNQPVAPSSGGQGGGVVQAKVTQAQIKALPATGSTTLAEIAATTVAILSGLALVTRFGNDFRRELAL